MSKQVLFCVETTKSANVDYRYITAVINRFYDLSDKKSSYKPIYLESKTKYKEKSKLKDIEYRKRNYKGETIVVYCIDYDDSDINADTKSLFDTIQAYCNKNNYEFVFFKRDVEDVFLGKCVGNHEKVKEANAFMRKNMIDKLDENALRESKPIKVHSSNLLTVLDRHFKRKK